MERNEIVQRICSVIREVCAVQSAEENALLKETLGLDSLSLVSLIVAIEEEFQIEFDESALDPGAITDVNSLVGLVEKTL